MNKKDIRNLVLIWIVSFILAILTGIFANVIRSDVSVGPSAQDATTTWVTLPATQIARLVQDNMVWTTIVIFPFLYGPILTLLYCLYRFHEKRNPEPDHFHENVRLEVFWTLVPAISLVVMVFPAYRVLQIMEHPPTKPDQVISVSGFQYFWQYNFPDYDVTVTDDGSGDNPLVLPVDSVIHLNGESPQVNHAWWVPAFGIKFDVIPGRITYGWFETEQQGFFKGQCAELCGELHAYMLIHVKVVPEKEFYGWLIENDAVFDDEELKKVRAYFPDYGEESGEETAENSASEPDEAPQEVIRS